jgi:class 3 adenylate cyclase
MHIFKILFIVLGVSALGYLNIDQNITVSPFFINQKIAINYIQIYIMINLLSLVINFAYSIITLFALNSKLFSIAQNLKRVCSWSLDENVLTNQIMHGQEELSNQERTILFGDIRGFTSFSNNNTNQIITFALRDFYETVEEVTEKYSAYKPEFIADEFITFFPTSKDAVDCALELRAKLTKSLKQYDLDVGMGLHRGEVLEGVIGGKFSKKYSVIGNAANIANRLEGTAKSREILCSKEVKRQIDHSYISSKRTVTLKGISDNFAAYSIKTKKGSIKNKTAKKQNDFKITPFKYAANILNKLGIEY